MIWKNVAIAGIGHYLPDTVLTSESIENQLGEVYQRLKLPFGRLELMTGIRERRYWERGTRPSQLAIEAALSALENSPIKKSQIDWLAHCSVCRDFLEPATASVVHAGLGLSETCGIFDLSNACLGMLSAAAQMAQLIETKVIRSALLVSGENSGPLLLETIKNIQNDTQLNRKNIKKSIANLTIGSAATAMILCHRDLAPESPKLLGGAYLTDSSANELCRGSGDTNGLHMETDSEALLLKGIPLAQKTWNKTKHLLNISNDDVNWVIGHQVGVAHEKLVNSALGLEKRPTFTTYELFGNTGSSAVPLTLSMAKDKKILKRNDTIALLGIGSGLTCHMLGVQW